PFPWNPYNKGNNPEFVFVDKNDNIFVCAAHLPRHGILQSCSEICVDKNENICVSDGDQLAVWKFDKNGKIVAGGNDYGQAPNQLFHPIGVTVCDGNGKGDGLNQLNHPCSVVIDSNEKQIYVDDGFNGRVVRSSTGAKKGEIIVNDDKNSNKPNERSRADGITFDADGNLCYRP
ncbi:unnamed protein product, partial [Rotaria sp. Silwood2]